MKIKTRLRLHAAIVLATVLLILLSVAWALRDIRQAERNLALSSEMQKVSLERILLQGDALLRGEEGLKAQWQAKSERLRSLLETASGQLVGAEDKALLQEARQDLEATVSLFPTILEKQGQGGAAAGKGFGFTEAESRLLGQVFLQSCALTDGIGRLLASAHRAGARARNWGAFLVVFFAAVGGAAFLAQSLPLNAMMAKRLAALREGAAVIGEGNLAHRIEAKGNDELADLARASNDMAARLQRSHTSVAHVQREIAERRNVEEALRETGRRLETTIMSSPLAIIAIDENDLVHLWNPAAERMFGWRAEEVLGHPIPTVPEDKKGEFENIRASIRQQQHAAIQRTQRRKKDGVMIDVSLSVAPVLDAKGRLHGRMGIFSDITEQVKAEAALRQSEETYRLLVENAAEAIFVAQEGMLQFVNQRTCEITGYAREDLVSRPFMEFLHPEDRSLVQDRHRQRQEGATPPTRYAFRFLDSLGRIRWADLNVVPIVWEGEKATLNFLTDITERKQAEDALKVERDNLHALMSAAPVALLVLDDRELIRQANPAAARLFPRSAAGPPNQRCGDVLGCMIRHDDPRGCGHTSRCDACLLNGAIRDVFRGGHGLRDGEMEAQIETEKGAEPRWFIVNVAAVTLDGSRQAIATLYDITERKRAEEALKKNEQRQKSYANLLAGLIRGGEFFRGSGAENIRQIAALSAQVLHTERASVWVYNDDYTELRCVCLFNRSTGSLSDGECLDASRFPRYTSSHQTGQLIAASDVRTDPRTREIPAAYYKAHGIRSLLDAPVWSRGKLKAVLSFEHTGEKRDWLPEEEQLIRTLATYISFCLEADERARAEEEVRRLNAELEERVRERTAQLEAANKELEAFSYSVSHDLRAPLRSIDGFSQALLEDYLRPLDETGRNHLERVRRAAQTMGLLIDDLLKLSRVSRAELRHAQVDLTQLVRDLAEKLREDDPGRSVELVVQEGAVVRGDPNLLQIALGNLLDNAWKFTGAAAHPRIEFGAAVEGGETACWIRDNGVGFDMAYAGKLFGAFQRLHTTEEFPGTGIGLATVKRIISRHGGRVWAEGKTGEGATFHFTLPVEQTDKR